MVKKGTVVTLITTAAGTTAYALYKYQKNKESRDKLPFTKLPTIRIPKFISSESLHKLSMKQKKVEAVLRKIDRVLKDYKSYKINLKKSDIDLLKQKKRTADIVRYKIKSKIDDHYNFLHQKAEGTPKGMSIIVVSPDGRTDIVNGTYRYGDLLRKRLLTRKYR